MLFVVDGLLLLVALGLFDAWVTSTPASWRIVAAVSALLVLMVRGHYRTLMTVDLLARVPLLGVASVVGYFASSVVAARSGAGLEHPMSYVASLVLGGLIGSVLGRRLLRALWASGRLRASALVFGDGHLDRELAVEVALRPEYGVDIVGSVTPPVRGSSAQPEKSDGRTWYDRQLDVSGADRLIIGSTSASPELVIEVARAAVARGLAVYVIPRLFEMGMGSDSLTPDLARGYPLVRLQRSAHPRVALIAKRVVDLTVAGLLLVVLAPLGALIASVLWLTDGSPVLFRQERIGQGGRRIVVRKFRSMRVHESGEAEWTADHRVTWMGRLLRRFDLDELPQLWSVLVGDMSLVGPRPERPAFVEHFRTRIPGYDHRHRMPVGLTGLAQVVGFRGDTSIAERVKYDNLYIDQWSLGADLRILATTVGAVVVPGARARRIAELEVALDLRREQQLPARDRPSGERAQPESPCAFGGSPSASVTRERHLAGRVGGAT